MHDTRDFMFSSLLRESPITSPTHVQNPTYQTEQTPRVSLTMRPEETSVGGESLSRSLNDLSSYASDGVRTAGQEQAGGGGESARKKPRQQSSSSNNTWDGDSAIHVAGTAEPKKDEETNNENDDDDDDDDDDDSDRGDEDYMESEGGAYDVDEFSENVANVASIESSRSQSTMSGKGSTASFSGFTGFRISPRFGLAEALAHVKGSPESETLQGLFIRWNLEKLGDIFQQHPDMAPGQFHIKMIRLLFEIAQKISRKAAEAHLRILVQERSTWSLSNKTSGSRPRTSGDDVEALAQFLRGKPDSRFAGSSTTAKRVRRLIEILRLHQTRTAEITVAAPRQDRPARATIGKIGSESSSIMDNIVIPAEGLSTPAPTPFQSYLSKVKPAQAQVSNSEFSPPTTKGPTSTSTGPFSTPGPKMPSRDPIVEIGLIYPELKKRKRAVEAAEERLEEEKRREEVMQNRVDSLAANLPESLRAGLLAFYEQRDE